MPRHDTPALVTVFGGGGFVGRYVTEALCRAGYRVRAADRHPHRAYRLQPLGAVGQVETIAADVTRPAHVVAALAGASAAVNLVGAFKGDLDALHVDAPRTIADAARAGGLGALVHVSAIGADAGADSRYARTKGEGEAALREGYAGATILRPSVLFGAEDDFTNRFARLAAGPVMPVLAGRTRFAPLWVGDLARAVVAAVADPAAHRGKTYELGGPEVMDLATIQQRIATMAGLAASPMELPDALGDLISRFGFLPGAPLSRDQWKLLQSDNVPAAGAPGFAALGIDPVAMESVAPEWLGRYRVGGRFAPAPTA